MYIGPEERKILEDMQMTIASLLVDLKVMASRDRIFDHQACYKSLKTAPVAVRDLLEPTAIASPKQIHDVDNGFVSEADPKAEVNDTVSSPKNQMEEVIDNPAVRSNSVSVFSLKSKSYYSGSTQNMVSEQYQLELLGNQENMRARYQRDHPHQLFDDILQRYMSCFLISFAFLFIGGQDSNGLRIIDPGASGSVVKPSQVLCVEVPVAWEFSNANRNFLELFFGECSSATCFPSELLIAGHRFVSTYLTGTTNLPCLRMIPDFVISHSQKSWQVNLGFSSSIVPKKGKHFKSLPGSSCRLYDRSQPGVATGSVTRVEIDDIMFKYTLYEGPMQFTCSYLQHKATGVSANVYYSRVLLVAVECVAALAQKSFNGGLYTIMVFTKVLSTICISKGIWRSIFRISHENVLDILMWKRRVQVGYSLVYVHYGGILCMNSNGQLTPKCRSIIHKVFLVVEPLQVEFGPMKSKLTCVATTFHAFVLAYAYEYSLAKITINQILFLQGFCHISCGRNAVYHGPTNVKEGMKLNLQDLFYIFKFSHFNIISAFHSPRPVGLISLAIVHMTTLYLLLYDWATMNTLDVNKISITPEFFIRSGLRSSEVPDIFHVLVIKCLVHSVQSVKLITLSISCLMVTFGVFSCAYSVSPPAAIMQSLMTGFYPVVSASGASTDIALRGSWITQMQQIGYYFFTQMDALRFSVVCRVSYYFRHSYIMFNNHCLYLLDFDITASLNNCHVIVDDIVGTVLLILPHSQVSDLADSTMLWYCTLLVVGACTWVALLWHIAWHKDLQSVAVYDSVIFLPYTDHTVRVMAWFTNRTSVFCDILQRIWHLESTVNMNVWNIFKLLVANDLSMQAPQGVSLIKRKAYNQGHQGIQSTLQDAIPWRVTGSLPVNLLFASSMLDIRTVQSSEGLEKNTGVIYLEGEWLGLLISLSQETRFIAEGASVIVRVQNILVLKLQKNKGNTLVLPQVIKCFLSERIYQVLSAMCCLGIISLLLIMVQHNLLLLALQVPWPSIFLLDPGGQAICATAVESAQCARGKCKSLVPFAEDFAAISVQFLSCESPHTFTIAGSSITSTKVSWSRTTFPCRGCSKDITATIFNEVLQAHLLDSWLLCKPAS